MAATTRSAAALISSSDTLGRTSSQIGSIIPCFELGHTTLVCRARNSVHRFVARWMYRKAEEEAASSANGDDENAARRRMGAEICGEFVVRDTR
jgi:hypothetical protein